MKRVILCAILAAILTASLCSATSEGYMGTGVTIDSLNIDMEMLPDARCHIKATLEASMEGADWSKIPIVSANMELNITKSGEKKVTMDIQTEIRLTEDAVDMLPQELLQLNAEAINLLIAASGITGKSLSELLGGFTGLGYGPTVEIPEEIMDVVIEELSVTQFSWQGTTLRFHVTCTLSGDVLGNENVEKRLPVNFSASMNVSETTISITMNGSSGKSRIEVRGSATKSGDITEIQAEANAYLELPVVDGQVVWAPPMPVAEGSLENLIPEQNVNFSLKVPENAKVESLPSGYRQSGNSYIWSGPEAAGAIGELLGGPVNVSYEYVPPTSDIFVWVIVGVVVAAAIASAGIIAVRRRK
ncbi:MAG: hypothetical protein QXG10_01880 [Candidatus Hadarchaeales archaeon]